jgi:hypothetical protein
LLVLCLVGMAVLAVAAGIWGLTLQARVARLDAFCKASPTDPACGDRVDVSLLPLPSVSPSGPAPSVVPSPSPSGDPALGGAMWFPPRADAASSIIIAAENSSASGRARADVVVRGSADDEINAALAQLSTIGGGQVTLLEGRYELDQSIQIDGDGLSLVGVNVGNGAGYAEEALGSQLVPSARFPAGQFLVNAGPEADGVLIALIHLDGMDRAQGMNVEGKRPTISLSAVSKSSDVGIRLAGESTGNRPYDGFVLFNRVFDGGGIGILNDTLSGDMLLEGNVVFRNRGDGFRCYGASEMYRVNHAYENGGVGLRIIPGCVRTRLSSNKWEGNAQGGVSIEGGSGYTIIGDTFAHNEDSSSTPQAHLQIGVRGAPTQGVMVWGLSFGKGGDENPYLIQVGSSARDVHIGPLYSSGGFTRRAVFIEHGAEVDFYDATQAPQVVLSP